VIQSGASGGLAFWTGLQEATVEFAGKRQSMTLRAAACDHPRHSVLSAAAASSRGRRFITNAWYDGA
jgi:hypothetical protein